MPAVAPFRLDKIVVASSFTLQALENARPSPGLIDLIESAAGERGPNFVATDKTEPILQFSTPQIATLLGSVGVNGLAPSGNVDMYRKLGTAVGNVARATTSHQRIRAASTLVYWTRITLPQRGRATAEVMICPVYDGTNEPQVYSGSVALVGSIDATALAYFQVGPVYLNTVQIGSIQEVVIESGAVETKEYAGGEHHPTYRMVEKIVPKYTIKTQAALGWSSPGPAGAALNGSDGLVVYARKIAANGARVANATGEHISFTTLNGRAKLLESNGNGTESGIDTIEVTASTPDDTIALMTISTSATIP